MSTTHCESCSAKPSPDVHLEVVVVQDRSFTVCSRCAEVAVPLQLPFEEDERRPRPCFYCGNVEDYDRDEQCPCLPVEPPVEEYDVRDDR